MRRQHTFLDRGGPAFATFVVSVAALFLATAPAAATIYTLTVQGSITYGYDYTGLFGSIGSLNGEAYTISMAFDTARNAVDEQYSTGECLYSSDNGTNNQQIETNISITVGGSQFVFPNAVGFGGFCINHIPTDNSLFDDIEGEFYGPDPNVSSVDQTDFMNVVLSSDSYQTDFIDSPQLDRLVLPLNYQPLPEPGGETSSVFRIGDPFGRVEIDTFGATLVTLSATRSVPEVATLPLLFAGLVGLGVPLQRRRRSMRGARLPKCQPRE